MEGDPPPLVTIIPSMRARGRGAARTPVQRFLHLRALGEYLCLYSRSKSTRFPQTGRTSMRSACKTMRSRGPFGIVSGGENHAARNRPSTRPHKHPPRPAGRRHDLRPFFALPTEQLFGDTRGERTARAPSYHEKDIRVAKRAAGTRNPAALPFPLPVRSRRELVSYYLPCTVCRTSSTLLKVSLPEFLT